MHIDGYHVIGILSVLALITGVGIWTGRKVSDAKDFSTGGGRASALVVAGTIIGTLVGGQATVGTAQLAFVYGMSAWWFTLGSGIGCLVLALAYVGPMRRSGKTTLVGVIQEDYGIRCDLAASVFSSIGTYISAVAQMIAAAAMLTTIFPINMLEGSLISVVIMAVYVTFGGVWGAGINGIIKLILLYVSCIVAGVLVLSSCHGVAGLGELLNRALVGSPLGRLSGITSWSDVQSQYTSLIARGPEKDIGSGLSLLLGVISTQSYASAVWSGKSDRTAKRGALISAFMIPPIGIACILIGLFMRGHCITEAELAALTAAGSQLPDGFFVIGTSAQVFPQFIIHYLPSLLGGIVLATLFITVVGGGAGLSFGVSTIVVNDMICRINSKFREPRLNLVLSRSMILLVLLSAAIVGVLLPAAMINDLGFLSMGLRGTVIFVPLTAVLFAKGRIPAGYGFACVVVGPIALILAQLLHCPIDPLFIGILAGVLIMCVGLVRGRKQERELRKSA